MTRKKPAKLPEGWKACKGIYKIDRTAKEMAEIWNNKNNEYYYKVFPKFETSFVVAKRLRSELQGE